MNTAPEVTAVHSQCLPQILIRAIVTVIGTLMTMVKPRETKFCICWTSLVERVISDAVEKRSISSSEKLSTLWKMSVLRCIENVAARRELTKPAVNEMNMLSTAHNSIISPAFTMSDIALPSVFTRRVISDI